MGAAGDILTTLILPLSGGVIAWLALGLSRRGAKRTAYEQRLADEFKVNEAEKALAEERRMEVKQRMDEQTAVNDRLNTENLRLIGENTSLRALRDAMEVRADAATTRVREDWEARWNRQMERCRRVTDSLATVIRHLSALVPEGDAATIDESRVALDRLDQHNEDDHPYTEPTTA